MVATASRRAPLAHESGGLARAAYDALAPFYDSFTGDYQYDSWLESLEIWARDHGLRGREVLDVACGTGKSFLPLLRMGYRVTGCDLSSQMVLQARAKAHGRARVVVSDMRALPWRSRFDLITCLDDAMNYLLTEEDLEAALASMWSALHRGGLLIFDSNSLATYRETFTGSFERSAGLTRFLWHGTSDPDPQPGSVCTATLEVDRADGNVVTRHVQRHWPTAVLREVAIGVGFDHVAFRGQLTGGRLEGEPDEAHHSKVVCLARKRAITAFPHLPARGQPRSGGETQ
jgi:SAM-dependent methyltransferase